MKISVHGPEGGCPAAPVSIPAPVERLDPAHIIGLVNVDTAEPKPVQVDSRGLLCWWEEPLAEDEVRSYRVHAAGYLAECERVVVQEHDDRAVVTEGGRPVATYRAGANLPRPFLEGMTSPNGHVLTRPAPAGVAAGDIDEPHQRACWVGWGDVNGVDHWSDKPGHGVQRHRRFGITVSGPVFAKIGAIIDWLDGEGRLQLTEHRVMKFYATHGPVRVIEFIVRFGPSSGPVTFGDTPEGGLCAIRVAPALSVGRGGEVYNAQSERGQAECWGSVANWCNYCGVIDGQPAGIAILDSPFNVRHPTHWLVTDAGLMAANPFGLAEFVHNHDAHGGRTWQYNDHIMFRYRILAYDGELGPQGVEAHYHAAAKPVHVDVE